MKIATILDQIDLGAMALPEFQRGYVWNRNQVRDLMHSLYRQHPVGSLLVWVTKTETARTRGDNQLQAWDSQTPPGRTAADHLSLRHHSGRAAAVLRRECPDLYGPVFQPRRGRISVLQADHYAG